jgi:hypothetical protein
VAATDTRIPTGMATAPNAQNQLAIDCSATTIVSDRLIASTFVVDVVVVVAVVVVVVVSSLSNPSSEEFVADSF